MSRVLSLVLSMSALLCASGITAPPSPVPEPSTYLMMGAGLGALIYVRNRYSKKK